MTLNGTLEDFSPAGILKVLSADGRTGAVRFGAPHGCTVYLHRGQIYFARNEGTDEALATALVRPGRLTADDWGRAIDASGDRPMVGELLVRDGAIGPDLLASVVLSVVYDPLIDLFRDGTGEFDFEPDTVHWLGPFRAFPVDAIVGEVRTRIREVDEWAATIPTLDAWVEARRTLPGNAVQVTILREDWELVTALSGPRTIRELAGELGRGAYSTARVVHRLHQAGLVEVISTTADAQVVQLHRQPDEETAPAPVLDAEVDPLLAMGLPHRTARPDTDGPETDAHRRSDPAAEDPLTAHIGDALADALTDADVVPVGSGPQLGAVADLADDVDHAGPDPALVGTMTRNGTVWSTPTGDDHAPSWDESRRVGGEAGALHHEDLAPTTLDEPRPSDPNAAWLADLYSQFIDEPEAANQGKKRRRGEPNPVDVAFKSAEQDGEEKVSTLKRLMGALKKL